MTSIVTGIHRGVSRGCLLPPQKKKKFVLDVCIFFVFLLLLQLNKLAPTDHENFQQKSMPIDNLILETRRCKLVKENHCQQADINPCASHHFTAKFEDIKNDWPSIEVYKQ
jgi:hypothetical protein